MNGLLRIDTLQNTTNQNASMGRGNNTLWIKDIIVRI